MGRLNPGRVEELVRGLALACRLAGCSLIGGETAEMPGIYRGNDFDLVGFIIGVVSKGEIITGQNIVAGDVLLGLPSSGLHTNGYSLARRALRLNSKDATSRLNQFYPELGRTLGEELLEPHRCYYPMLKPVLPLVKGLAHITGGGLLDNLPRILPVSLAAQIDKSSWSVTPIFDMIQKKAKVAEEEMYRVFNMGVGMVVITSPGNSEELLSRLPGAWRLGQMVQGDRRVFLY